MKDQFIIALKAVFIVVCLVAIPMVYVGIAMHDNHATERAAAWEAYREAECTPAGFTAVVERGRTGNRTPGETAELFICPRLGEKPVVDLARGPRPFWEVETAIADAALCRARAKSYPWAKPCAS